jgi:nuclear pore complex protein Nup88
LNFFLNIYRCYFELLSSDILELIADRSMGVELDALHSAIEALSARMKRYNGCHASSVTPRKVALRGRTPASEANISLLKSSLEQLSIMNKENTQKLKLLEEHFANLEM